MTTETQRLVTVEQAIQKLRYQYHFQITLKSGQIGFKTEIKFTPNQIEDVQNQINIIKTRKELAFKILNNTKDYFIQTLIDQQRFCTLNYDLYMNDNKGVKDRWEASLIDFSHTEMMLDRDFDYGLTCIHEVTEAQAIETLERDTPYYGCPDEPPMVCRYCERKKDYGTEDR